VGASVHDDATPFRNHFPTTPAACVDRFGMRMLIVVFCRCGCLSGHRTLWAANDPFVGKWKVNPPRANSPTNEG
jgi:hypothetical protein